MRIAIEALGANRPGGGRTATMSFLRALLNHDVINEYDVWLSEPEPSLPSKARQIIVPVRQRIIARLVLQVLLPIQVRQRRIDLVHFAKNLTVAMRRPYIVTVYDLANIVRPEIFPTMDNWYWRAIQPTALRHARRVIAISEQTASDIVMYYQIPRSRVAVVYPPHDPCFSPQAEPVMRDIRTRYHLEQSYILHVGAISVKKNLVTLVRAFHRLRHQGYVGQLVLVGPRYPRLQEGGFTAAVNELGLGDEIRMLGTVPSDDLPGIYSAADLFAFPSLYEGFGIAPLEAMACGTPVVVSPAGALSEMVGDAGMVMRSATDFEDLARLMTQILTDSTLAGTLRQRGFARAATFAPDHIAAQMLKIYSTASATSARSSFETA